MRYKVVIAYDGSKFIGWQVNPLGPSVLSTLNRAFKVIYKEDLDLVGSGRTDRGVSALGQVFHFDAPFFIEEDRLLYALNNQLHPYIHIREIVSTEDDFHARYHALAKHYRYTIETGPYQVLEADYVMQLNKALDVDLMEQVAGIFKGTHDFTSFNTTTLAENENQVRTILKLQVSVNQSKVMIDFIGTGFLRYMVRMMAQTMIEVGLLRLSVREVEAMLLAKQKGVCRYKAPANGLVLHQVFYDKAFIDL